MHRRRHRPAVRFSLYVRSQRHWRFEFPFLRRKKHMNTFPILTALLIAITNIVDADGQPTTLVVTPVWTSSDATILSPVPAADGLSATGTALKDGTVTVTATSGAISATAQITVTSGTAVSFQLSVSVVPVPVTTAGIDQAHS